MRTTQLDPAEARLFVAKLNEDCRDMAQAMAAITATGRRCIPTAGMTIRRTSSTEH